MNDWLCEPLSWDDSRRYDRGKVMTSEELEAGQDSAATSTSTATASPTAPTPAPTRRAAPSSPAAPRSDRYARYTEEGAAYVDNMQRLLRKFETAKALVPAPGPAARRRADALRRDLFRLDRAGDGARRSTRSRPQGVHLDTLRVRAFPFTRRRCPSSSPPTTRCSWSSRTATASCARCWWPSAASTRRARPGPALRRHADHRALHRRGDRPAASPLPTSCADGP